MSNSLRHHELQHARLPCPLLTPIVGANSNPLSQGRHPTFSSFVAPFFSCPQSFPASGFHWVGSSHQWPKYWSMCAKSLQSCPTLCDPMDHSPPGSSVHGILYTRILVSFHALFHGSFWPRDRTACLPSPTLTGSFCTISTTWEAPLEYKSSQKTNKQNISYFLNLTSINQDSQVIIRILGS